MTEHDAEGREFFETPMEAVEAIEDLLPRADCVVDPCCGNLAILRHLRHLDSVPARWGRMCGMDIEPAKDPSQFDVVTGDYLKGGAVERLGLDRNAKTLFITCPPFSLALEFIQQAMCDLAGMDGRIWMLLKSDFNSTKDRLPFHRWHPSHQVSLHKRPCFTQDGRTDRYGYSWFSWGEPMGTITWR